MAFRVEGGHRRVRLRHEADRRRERSLDIGKTDQAGGVGPQKGSAPAGRCGHVHGVQRQPQHIREQLPPARGQSPPAGQPQTRRAMLREQGIQRVADRKRGSFERAPQERGPVAGERQPGPGAAELRVPIRCPFPRKMRDKDRVVRLAAMIGARVQLRPGGVHDLSHPVETEPCADGGAHLVPAVRSRRPVEVDPGVRPADRRGKRPDDLRAGADSELDVARADPAAQGGRRRVAGPGRDGDSRGQPQLGSSLGREVAGGRSGRGQQGRQQAGLQTESADHLKVPAVIDHVVEQRG